jgi:hypothetical protein
MPQKIATINQLRNVVGFGMVHDIIEQWKKGDPDWLDDIVAELDDPPGHYQESFKQTWFKPLAEYRSTDFDLEAIHKDIADRMDLKSPTSI